MKRTIAIGSVLLILLLVVTASATTVGSTTSPLISRNYLEGTYATALKTEITGTLGAAADKAMARLDDIQKSYIGYSFAPCFTQVSISEGGTASLVTGGSFILLSGTATLNVTSGTVIDISTGSEAESGVRLAQNHRYFCAENTTALITASSAISGQVDGHYLMEGGSKPVTKFPFTDVPAGAWFFTAIDFAYNNELFAGTTTTTFSPNTPMTRAMFVTVLHRLDGRPAAGSSSSFSDVSNPSQYYYNAVIWANANGIVTGNTDGTFKPDSNVTREQMAAIIYRYATYKEKDLDTPNAVFDAFPDRNAVSGYAAQAMRWAASWKVINGSGGRLLPQNTATRAEVAQIIYNYCKEVGQ